MKSLGSNENPMSCPRIGSVFRSSGVSLENLAGRVDIWRSGALEVPNQNLQRIPWSDSILPKFLTSSSIFLPLRIKNRNRIKNNIHS